MTTLNIPDMSCGHCRARVEKTVQALDPEARLDFDMAARRVDVQSNADLAAITAALSEAGYPATAA